MDRLTTLPDEVILKVIAGLRGSVQDLAALQLVCHKFHQLARDGAVWRDLCFDGSIAGRRHNRATIPKTIPSRQVQALQAEAAAVTSATLEASLEQSAEAALESRRNSRAREIAKWDAYNSDESTNWYQEYIAREAAIDVKWTYQDETKVQEIEGLACHRASDGAKSAVARFDDFRVGIWTFDGGEDSQGRSQFIQSSSSILQSGYPEQYDGMLQDQASISDSVITDCISIDRARQKAYVAVDCQLNEVDLNTLQLSGLKTFPRPISALSNMPGNLPLIVGTSSGLYRHDSRVPPRWHDGTQLFQHQQAMSEPALAPGPLLSYSIFQTPMSGFGSGTSEIYAAGRYPTILTYDQRSFPKVSQSIWSGADISSLSVLPRILPQIPRGNDLLSSPDQLPRPPSSGHTILAGGAKNGKGSLELYGIDCSTSKLYGTIRNRTMASRVKLLSVTPHGKRICASDADGNIKWFERDGFNLVRQVNTNDLLPKKASDASNSSSPGLFGVQQDNGDVVQKLIPTGKEENADLLVWAGGRAGLLRIGKKLDDREQDNKDSDATNSEARKYEEHMRRLLEAQAMEARRIQDFGMQ